MRTWQRRARLRVALCTAMEPFGETIRVRTVAGALFSRLGGPGR